MTKKKFKAWALAIFTSVMLMYVLPQFPLALGLLGVAVLCVLVFRWPT